MLLKRVKLLATLKDGTTIKGYRVVTIDNEVINIERDKIYELAALGYVDNATAIKKPGSISLCGKGCHLRDLPCIQLRKLNNDNIMYIITHRIVNDRHTIGYRIKSETGVAKEIDIDEGLKLARDKRIKNVAIQKYNDYDYRLRGRNGFSLEKLPVINM